jgi:membrane protease YdiL (CAAX protease family)
MNKTLSVLIAAFYTVFRIIADPLIWQNVSEYFSYAFDVAFVGIAYFLFRREIQFSKRPTAFDALFGFLMLISGFLIFKTAGLFLIPIPFDFSSAETLMLLLVLGPLLEELIFRMALWQALNNICSSKWFVIGATSFLFAAAHFAPYWAIPEQFQGFLIYQTVYVMFLGLAVGVRRSISQAILPAVFMHIGFNLGFFLASQI